MKSPRWFPLLAFLLLLPLAPAEVAAQEQHLEGITLRNLWIFPAPGGGLWRTDGTAGGTFQLGPCCSGDDRCDPIVGRAGGRVFFLVEVPQLSLPNIPRHQLWATDGSRGGTHQLTDFPEGLPGSGTRGDYSIAPELGLLFFRGSTPATGEELWVSDGTLAGTRAVADLAPGPADGLGRLLGVAGGRMLFEGITPRRGAELWKSDGTTIGTRLLLDFQPGPASSEPRGLTTWNGRMFFSFAASELAHQLWLTDGTAMGTKLVYELRQPADLDWPFGWLVGASTTTQAFFVVHEIEGVEMPHTLQYLVRSDGTPEGTYPLRNAARYHLVPFGDSLLFVSGDSEHGTEPWITDGTPEGTHLVADLEPGVYSNDIWAFFPVGSLAYILVDWHFDAGGFVTDGTPEGTRHFFTFQWAMGYSPGFAVGPQDRLFFQTGLDGEQELWVTPAVDGASGSTTQLLDSSPLRSLTPLNHTLIGTSLGGVFLFLARDSENGVALWRSDATPSGTYPVAVISPAELPGPIARLTAQPVGAGTGDVVLTWSPAERAHYYEIGGRSPEIIGYWVTYPQDSERAHGFTELTPGLPYAFRVRAWNDFGPGPWTAAAATPLPALITPCVPGEESLCLHGSRFEVKVFYSDHIHDTWDVGHTAPLDFSDDSGAFWFFDRDNLELMVKVLDARVVNGYFWSFFGGLTTLETWITVTDTEAQTNATSYKSPDDLCGQADVKAFPRPAFEALVTHGTCEPGPDHLCLTGDRYRVEVSWRDQRSGHTGVGHPIPGTEDSGFFWFFDHENVELLVKVLDARTVNGHVWVFSGAMTDVEYTLTVTDTLTGERQQYVHPPGSLCGQADVAAF